MELGFSYADCEPIDPCARRSFHKFNPAIEVLQDRSVLFSGASGIVVTYFRLSEQVDSVFFFHLSSYTRPLHYNTSLCSSENKIWIGYIGACGF